MSQTQSTITEDSPVTASTDTPSIASVIAQAKQPDSTNAEDDNPIIVLALDGILKGRSVTVNIDTMSTDWADDFDGGLATRCKALSECIVEWDFPNGFTEAEIRKMPVRKIDKLATAIVEVMYGPKKQK